MRFPEIILNKVYEYLFRLKQRDLCQEYHKRIKYDTCIYLDENPQFNWRNIANTSYYTIYNIKGKYSNKILPKNYKYSNGKF